MPTNSANRYRPLIGAHVSVAGGLLRALGRAHEIEAEAIQIFGSSPLQWRTRFPDGTTCHEFKLKHEESGLGPVFLHAIYLINLASPSEELREKSVENLIEHLTVARDLGAAGLIFHPGSGKGLPRETALNNTADGIRKVIETVEESPYLIVENSAGSGEHVGACIPDFEHLLSLVDSPKLKVCLDTAHAFQSRMIPAFTPSGIAEFSRQWDQLLKLDTIVVVHANDSKTPAGSHHDRHENIGAGFIGMMGFRVLAQSGIFNSIPWIIETPGFNKKGPDIKNIRTLKKVFSGLK